METSIPPAFLSPNLPLLRRHSRQRRLSFCPRAAATAPGQGDVVGPSSRSHRNRNRNRDRDPSERERDVIDALRPTRDELAAAERHRARERARAQIRPVKSPAPPPVEQRTLEVQKRTRVSPLETTSALAEAPVANALLSKDDQLSDAKVHPAVISATPEKTIQEDDITASWTRRGYASAISRTVEIWAFFFRMVMGELRIRKMTDLKAASEARTKHAKALKDGLLSLGPTFIKIGQLLSTRVDIVPKEYIEELTSLQDRVPGFTGTRAIEVIEAEFGRPIAEIYDFFDPTPLAAASLGQVHRGVHKGEEVAIKIQRAGLKELFDVDLKNLKVLARMLDRFDPKNDGTTRNWVQIYDESAKLLYEEIDYILEGKNAEKFKKNFASTPWVKVPNIYWDRTSHRVLTMEYVPGIKINDYESIEKAGLDRSVLASRSAESYLTQLLRHGYFHTDPHCGNLAVDTKFGGRLIYYDFGMMSAFAPHIKQGLVEVIFGIYEGNAREICDAMVRMGVLSRAADRITVEKVGRYFLGLFRTNLKNENRKKTKEEKRAEMIKRLDSIGEDLLAVSEDECFSFPPVFTFVFRAFTTLEGIGKGLDPAYDLTIIAGPYLKELIDLKDGSATLTAIKSFQKRVGWRGEDIAAVVTQPRKTAYIENTLKRMESGDLRLRVRVLESERAFKRVILMQTNMSLTLLAATFANMACVLSTASEKFALQARVLWLLAAIATIRLIIGVIKYRGLEGRLRKYTKSSF